MKKLMVVMAVLLATGCASQSQKDEIALLKDIHKAERKINSGKADVLIGSGIIAGGNAKISEGEEAKAEAVKQLQESLK